MSIVITSFHSQKLSTHDKRIDNSRYEHGTTVWQQRDSYILNTLTTSYKELQFIFIPHFQSLIILEPKRGLTWQNPWYQHMPTTFFKTIVKLVFYSLQRYIIQQITTDATDWNWFTNSRWSTLWRSWKTDLVSVVLILNPLIVTPEINSINCGIIRIISLVCGCWHNFMETFCQIALRRSCLQKTATKNTGPQIWCDMCRLDTIHYLLPANIADVLAPRAV